MRGRKWIVFLGFAMVASLVLASAAGALQRTVLMEMFTSTG
jgi:hypothetical protein